MRILVTGASGFVGSNFIRYVLQNTDYRVRAQVRYRSKLHNRRLYGVPEIARHLDTPRLDLFEADLLTDLSGLCEKVDLVINFAAKIFTDHSIREPLPFIDANFMGTYRLLEESRRNHVERFIQISTDEVYGPILWGHHHEDAPIKPTNPYAASKAAADAFVISYAHSSPLQTAIVRTQNVYGRMQHPMKVIPTFVRRALADELLVIYGDGQHKRQWLWVDDLSDGLVTLIRSKYKPGEVFHLAGDLEHTTEELAKRVLWHLRLPQTQLAYVNEDQLRPNHERRCALACDKIRALGWKPKTHWDGGLSDAVNWYKDHPEWFD